MKSLQIEIPYDDFLRYPVPYGWKHEYLNGTAYLSPYAIPLLVKREIGKLPLTCNLPEQAKEIPVIQVDREKLVAIYVEAFADGPEFCDWPLAKIKETAIKDLDNCFGNRHGLLKPELCRVLVRQGTKQDLLAACLVAEYPQGLKVNLVFVAPGQQRQGLGTAMVAGIINQCYGLGIKALYSSCTISNSASRNWYAKLGFTPLLTIKRPITT